MWIVTVHTLQGLLKGQNESVSVKCLEQCLARRKCYKVFVKELKIHEFCMCNSSWLNQKEIFGLLIFGGVRFGSKSGFRVLNNIISLPPSSVSLSLCSPWPWRQAQQTFPQGERELATTPIPPPWQQRRLSPKSASRSHDGFLLAWLGSQSDVLSLGLRTCHQLQSPHRLRVGQGSSNRKSRHCSPK